jgi:Protein of unknown function (DUF1573)
MKSIFVLLAVLFPALSWAAPAIEFQTMSHDFGEVAQGPPLEYSFEFTNAGPDELVIKEVNTS